MGAYLWNNENIYKGLNFDETILNSDFFNNFPFKKNIKKKFYLIQKHIMRTSGLLFFYKDFRKFKRN